MPVRTFTQVLDGRKYKFSFARYRYHAIYQAAQVVSGLKSTAAKILSAPGTARRDPVINHSMDCAADAGLPLLHHYHATWQTLQEQSTKCIAEGQVAHTSIVAMRKRMEATSNSYVQSATT